MLIDTIKLQYLWFAEINAACLNEEPLQNWLMKSLHSRGVATPFAILYYKFCSNYNIIVLFSLQLSVVNLLVIVVCSLHNIMINNNVTKSDKFENQAYTCSLLVVYNSGMSHHSHIAKVLCYQCVHFHSIFQVYNIAIMVHTSAKLQI